IQIIVPDALKPRPPVYQGGENVKKMQMICKNIKSSAFSVFNLYKKTYVPLTFIFYLLNEAYSHRFFSA
ncbi:hypothetical protein SJ059_29735, partial [Klebsiella aerogenes]|nr:hypothetical protein [Klebsiella aerogenes]